jgi:hypothetical protein
MTLLGAETAWPSAEPAFAVDDAAAGIATTVLLISRYSVAVTTASKGAALMSSSPAAW